MGKPGNMDRLNANKAQLIADHVGAKIRRARRSLDLTLNDLGQRANLSPAFLSRLERGETTTSIGNLIAISSCLGVAISELFVASVEDSPVKDFTLSRGKQRNESIPLKAGDYSFFRLCGGLFDPLLNAFELVFPVGGKKNFDLLTHEGQEIFYILEGEIEFQIGSSVFRMEAGDCVHLNSKTPHMGWNIGKIPVRAIMVVTPWGALEDRFVTKRAKPNEIDSGLPRTVPVRTTKREKSKRRSVSTPQKARS
jgi:transcriptional regulator with XRE-family HTH domain